MHTCISKLTIIRSDNGLSPDLCQAIIWTNAGILLIGHLGTNFSEVLIKIHIFSFKKMHSKRSSGKWRSFCTGLHVFTFPMLRLEYSRTCLIPWPSLFQQWGPFLSFRVNGINSKHIYIYIFPNKNSAHIWFMLVRDNFCSWKNNSFLHHFFLFSISRNWHHHGTAVEVGAKRETVPSPTEHQ